MKKVFCISLCFLLSYNLFGQEVQIETIDTKNFVSEYAKKIINNNILDNTCSYKFILIQEGNTLTIKYHVSPYNIEGSEYTNNVGGELEMIIKRACEKIGQQIENYNSYPDNTSSDNRSTKHSNEVRQTEQPQKQQYQPQDQQPKQQYQPPIGKQVVERPLQEQKRAFKQQHDSKQMGNSLTGWLTNTFGSAYSDDVVANIRLNEYSISDVQNGKAQIGGLIIFSDGSKGIIYYLDGQGHGLAVSLDQDEMKWQEAAKAKYCQDIYQLPNEKVFSQYCNIGLGGQQSGFIFQQIGYQSPAVCWCMAHGNDWYLPSAGELWELLNVANASKGQAGIISLMIQAAGGSPINGKWYWSSSEVDLENAHNISSFGTKATENKTSKNAVRAVRAF